MRFLKLFLSSLFLLFVVPAFAGGGSDTASRQMVVAANPYAAEAGLDILRRGGSAVAAATVNALARDAAPRP